MKLVDIPNAGEGASAIWERLLLIPLPVIIFWIIWVIYKSVKNEQIKGQYKESTSKNCPDCLGNIPKLAKKCMHCGTVQPEIVISEIKPITAKQENTKKEVCPHCLCEIIEGNTMCFNCLRVVEQ
jgi:hypothetical protein